MSSAAFRYISSRTFIRSSFKPVLRKGPTCTTHSPAVFLRPLQGLQLVRRYASSTTDETAQKGLEHTFLRKAGKGPGIGRQVIVR
jgi:hypothetical protein